MSYRLVKALNTIAYAGLIWLTIEFIDGQLHWRLAIGAVILSGCWLGLTFMRSGYLLKTYFDTLSRLEVLIPATLGLGLSCFALLRTPHLPVGVIAVIELVGWALLVHRYRRNRQRYMRQGHGPVPAGCWISPPESVLQPGDMLLTSGMVARNLRESVGHGETIVRDTDGTLHSFSSYMGRGAVLHDLEAFTRRQRETGHYIALRLADGLTEAQAERAVGIARQMLEDNARWRRRANARRRRFVDRLPLPASWRRRIWVVVQADGYDWLGLFMGRLARDRWTCVGACLELYARLGVKTRPWGTGLLGFGTSLLDPIMPVRLLADPAFELLRDDDHAPGP